MIFRSPYPDVTIPEMGLTPFVLRHADRLADKPALIDGPSGRILTYGQLADGVQRVAAGLARRGFRKGDVFATVCPNLPEFALAFYGVASLGGATTMLNPLYTAEEMHRQLADAGARFVLTVPERLGAVREAATGTRVEEVFVLGEAAGASPFGALLQADDCAPGRRHRSRRGRGRPPLLQRHDRPPERGDADPPQPDRGRPGLAGGGPRAGRRDGGDGFPHLPHQRAPPRWPSISTPARRSCSCPASTCTPSSDFSRTTGQPASSSHRRSSWNSADTRAWPTTTSRGSA